MPTYDYKCDACGHQFEQYQSITAGALKKCPKCGKNKLRRLIGAGAGLLFKGSGFYITDYRSEKYKNSAKADSGATGSDASNTKTDNKSSGDKPAPKSDATPAKKEPKPIPKNKGKD